jgi:membrane protein YdbS with pleckstrin-like domain
MASGWRSETMAEARDTKKKEGEKLSKALMPGETVIADVKPFPAAFLPFYLPGALLFLASIIMMFCRPYVMATVSGGMSGLLASCFLLGLFVVVPALAYSFIKLNFRWVVKAVAVVLLALVVKHMLLGQPTVTAPDKGSWLMSDSDLIVLAVLGLMGVFATEAYRRSHRYLLTSKRIQTSAGILWGREHVLPLSSVTDVSMDHAGLGRVFGYATLIPVTASGAGMSSDLGALSGSGLVKWLAQPTLAVTIPGGLAVHVPRSKTYSVLFGVRNADVVKGALMQHVARREQPASQAPAGQAAPRG